MQQEAAQGAEADAGHVALHPASADQRPVALVVGVVVGGQRRPGDRGRRGLLDRGCGLQPADAEFADVDADALEPGGQGLAGGEFGERTFALDEDLEDELAGGAAIAFAPADADAGDAGDLHEHVGGAFLHRKKSLVWHGVPSSLPTCGYTGGPHPRAL